MSKDRDHPAVDFAPAPNDPAIHRQGWFPTTHWSLVLRAGTDSTTESIDALDRLCRQYWRPLYFFVRRRGYDPHDAQDLTQAFFTRLLEKQTLGAADPERGRFRTYLLSSLKNYLTNEWDRANREKRGGGQDILSFELASSAEENYRQLPSDGAAPDRFYDRFWAQAVLESVLRRLRQEFDAGGGAGRFNVLKEFLFSDRGESSYADAADRLNLSESAVKSAVHRLRRRCGQLLTDEITQTVSRAEDVDDEIRYLLGVLEGTR